MKTLQELLKLREDQQDSQQMDVNTFAYGIEDLTDAFPNKHAKAMLSLWNKPGKLTWHGLQLFGNNEEYGPALTKAINAVVSAMKEYEVEDAVSETIVGTEWDGEELQVDFFMSFDMESVKSPEWIAYNKEHDSFLFGLDLWMSSDVENVFTARFDKAFKKLTGIPYDEDDEEHNKVFQQFWKSFINGPIHGAIVEVTFDGGFHAEVLEQFTFEDGFWRKSLPALKRSTMYKDLFVPTDHEST